MVISSPLDTVVKDADQCVYCGQPLTLPHIMWLCGEHELFVHPACAVDFCLRLLRDVHEVECRQHLGVTLTTDAARERHPRPPLVCSP